MRKGERLDESVEEGGKYGNEKPISLYPLTPQEALRRAMSVPPPPKPERAKKRRQPEERS
jgi:hypothetical protein